MYSCKYLCLRRGDRSQPHTIMTSDVMDKFRARLNSIKTVMHKLGNILNAAEEVFDHIDLERFGPRYLVIMSDILSLIHL